MNALQPYPRAESVRPQPYSTARYAAFRIDNGRTYPVRIEATNLRDALNAALPACLHKDILVIQEMTDGRSRLHLYAIKRKSAPDYVWKDHQQIRIQRLYPEAICSFEGAVADVARVEIGEARR